MPVAVTIPSYHHHRIYASLFAIAKFNKSTMASSSNNNSGAFTTIKERITFEKDIKKSKFIAIAGSVSDDKSAMSFLSQVTSFTLSIISSIPSFFNCYNIVNQFIIFLTSCLLLGPGSKGYPQLLGL